MRQRTERNRAGDTLVEVLISMLLVSLVLTGAYVTVNRSTLAIRDAQEHAEALKLLQGQLEQVRYNADGGNKQVFSQPGEFCMVDGKPLPSAIQPGLAKCLQDAAGEAAAAQPAYRLRITRTACGGTCQSFTIQAVWDSISSRTQARDQITYRLHQ